MSWLSKAKKKVEETVAPVVQAAEKVIEVVVEVQMAPVTIAVDAVTGKPVDQSIAEIGKSIADGTNAAAVLATYPDTFYVDLAGKVGGDTGKLVAEGQTAGRVYSANFGAALVDMIAGGGPPPTPEQIATAPLSVYLAAAIKSAASQLRGGAKTVPPLVRMALAPYFDPKILSKARYVVGKVGITLPEAINGFKDFMGEHAHAVTVDDVIVFSIEPDQSTDAIHWWAHELEHVAQYDRMGVADFASTYLTDYQSIESAAEAKAASIPL